MVGTFGGLKITTVTILMEGFRQCIDDYIQENGTDFKRSATVTEYAPAAATITPKSADGAAFDDDEYAAGDVTATRRCGGRSSAARTASRCR